jgi:hypothetical protein
MRYEDFKKERGEGGDVDDWLKDDVEALVGDGAFDLGQSGAFCPEFGH